MTVPSDLLAEVTHGTGLLTGLDPCVYPDVSLVHPPGAVRHAQMRRRVLLAA
jgi:hypothetical protein